MTTAREIIRKVAERTGVPVEDLFSRSRKRDICNARQRAMYALRKCPLRRAERSTHRSYPEIAAMFHRDHTTAIWALKMEAFRRGLAPDPRPSYRDRKLASMRALRARQEAQG